MSCGSQITDEDLAAFKRDGFVLKKAMYTPEEISLLHDISKGEQYVAFPRLSSVALRVLCCRPHSCCTNNDPHPYESRLPGLVQGGLSLWHRPWSRAGCRPAAQRPWTAA